MQLSGSDDWKDYFDSFWNILDFIMFTAYLFLYVMMILTAPQVEATALAKMSVGASTLSTDETKHKHHEISGELAVVSIQM
jgi:hypothetical protein